ncbi:MAG: FMN-binding negative transcriptional regulator [Pedobacter sp.]|nr:MAG: FMN-binding negative transcriptional regulator [Pedobacter sp.]
MYIPNNFSITDQNEIVAFMKAYSFATIISAKENMPTATHLPFIVSTREDKVILTSHFAKANDHWKELEANKSLIIFNQPHAYISPSHYERELNVPTWNYIAVHAYGDARIIIDEQSTFDVLEATINNYEAGYKNQWDNLPFDYKMKLSKGIVAFEVTVTDLQAKKKLSQNKSEKEQKNIIDSLSLSEDKNERDIAAYMTKHKVE